MRETRSNEKWGMEAENIKPASMWDIWIVVKKFQIYLLQSFHIGTESLDQFEDRFYCTIWVWGENIHTTNEVVGAQKPKLASEKYIYECRSFMTSCTCREGRCLCKRTSHPNKWRELTWLVKHITTVSSQLRSCARARSSWDERTQENLEST